MRDLDLFSQPSDEHPDVQLQNLKCPEPERRAMAALQLGCIRAPEGTDELLELLGDSDPDVCAASALTLGCIHATGLGILLVQLLTDDSPRSAQHCLDDVPTRPFDTLTCSLLALLNRPESDVRGAAALALGLMYATGATDQLLELLDDPDPHVRENTAIALGLIQASEHVQRRIADQQRQANDPHSGPEQFSMADLFESDTNDALTKLIDDPEDSVRSSAVTALGLIRSNAANSHLLELLESADTDTRESAIFALGRIQSNDATERLLSLLADPNPTVRRLAAYSLGEISDHRASTPLLDALNDSDPFVAVTSAVALGRLGTPCHFPSSRIVRHLEHLSDGEDRWLIYHSLRVLGPRSLDTSLFADLLDYLEMFVHPNPPERFESLIPEAWKLNMIQNSLPPLLNDPESDGARYIKWFNKWSKQIRQDHLFGRSLDDWSEIPQAISNFLQGLPTWRDRSRKDHRIHRHKNKETGKEDRFIQRTNQECNPTFATLTYSSDATDITDLIAARELSELLSSGLPHHLTPVFRELAHGQSVDEIAESLRLSRRTVYRRREEIMRIAEKFLRLGD